MTVVRAAGSTTKKVQWKLCTVFSTKIHLSHSSVCGTDDLCKNKCGGWECCYSLCARIKILGEYLKSQRTHIYICKYERENVRFMPWKITRYRSENVLSNIESIVKCNSLKMKLKAYGIDANALRLPSNNKIANSWLDIYARFDSFRVQICQ